MAVKLRLVRMGKKRNSRPTGWWRPTAARPVMAVSWRSSGPTHRGESRPPSPTPSIIIDNAKALKWLGRGAQPTEQVERLLKTSGAWDEFTAAKAK